MANVRDIKLEFLRPGPAHNQLLSPLTPYIALCNGEGPTTLYMPFEHQQLLTRLERLRYVSYGKELSEQQSDAEVHELGRILGDILSQVPTLISSLGSACCKKNQLIHLRLTTKAYEISLIPFELSLSSAGFPGSGSPLFLQSNEPITITREAESRLSTPINWNRPPRILFAFASPGNLPAVPFQDHLKALRRAIEPWVEYKKEPVDRIEQVKKLLTVLPNASLKDIREACAKNQYTYVHILAHGAAFDHQGHTDYGLALCDEVDSNKKNVIDGATLAFALTAKDSLEEVQARPTLVSLATCDSANTGTTLVPGGSIAHSIHAAGIPWVVASQFPLWMRASTITTETLYQGLFKGEDPRWLLYNLRQRLRTDCVNTHDWASIVTYASIPKDFDQQVHAFSTSQRKARIDVLFDKTVTISEISKIDRSIEDKELTNLYDDIRYELEQWQSSLTAHSSRQERAKVLGIRAASEKRIGNLCIRQGNIQEATEAYQNACDFYKQALLVEPTNHWVITQYLSMRAVLINTEAEAELLAKELKNWWIAVKQTALWQYTSASSMDKIWALATRAELELLGATYDENYQRSKTKKELTRLCKELLDLIQSADLNTFPIFSSCRQFKRYRDDWSDDEPGYRKEWGLLAKTAIEALGE